MSSGINSSASFNISDTCSTFYGNADPIAPISTVNIRMKINELIQYFGKIYSILFRIIESISLI